MISNAQMMDVSIPDSQSTITMAGPEVSKVSVRFHVVVVDMHGTAVLPILPNAPVASPPDGGRLSSDSSVAVVDMHGTAVQNIRCPM
jgi:uncharacterized protein GlcG (DUF336 family)